VLYNDGPDVLMENGKTLHVEIDASEKVYADFQLTVTSPGGHSSVPVPDNAIYHLTGGLDRLSRYEFPFELSNVTREYYERQATLETGSRAADMRAILKVPPDPAAIARLASDPLDHAVTHTTCVATVLEADHANNALPQAARAIVNCRINIESAGMSRRQGGALRLGNILGAITRVRRVREHGSAMLAPGAVLA